jgi:hypothetical protein
MPTLTKHNHLSKLLLGIAFLFVVCLFACNGSGSSTTKDSTTIVKDSTMTKDSTGMKMKTDSTKTDTSGRGGQPAPPQK